MRLKDGETCSVARQGSCGDALRDGSLRTVSALPFPGSHNRAICFIVPSKSDGRAIDNTTALAQTLLFGLA
jgi:hypothetical protein